MSKYVVHTDVVFSRRKTLHHILDENQEPCWTGKTIAAAFVWLAEHTVYEFRLEGNEPDTCFQVMIHRD